MTARGMGEALRLRIERLKSEFLANIEKQLVAASRFDDDHWAEILEASQRAVQRADHYIAQACRALGIRERFHSGLIVGWLELEKNALARRAGIE